MSTIPRETQTQLANRRGERALAMAEKYQAGATLQEIGDYYGLTRERVRQLMTGELGITRKDGGSALRNALRQKALAERRELSCLRRHGMTKSEFERINSTLDAGGKAPIVRFRSQRGSAGNRGIKWNLTFAEWWSIWTASGKWAERGVGSGYVMARHGDRGPYATGNVKIINGVENQSEYIRRYWKQVREGKRPPPGGKPGLLTGLEVGQTIAAPITQKRPEYARNSAWYFAKVRGWKVKTSTHGGVLTVTRIK